MKQFLGRFFQMSDVLDELLAGILFYGLICQAGLLLFGKGAPYHSIGLWIGVVLAILGAFHITWTLDRILDLGAEDAVKKSRSYAVLRYGFVLIVLGALMIVNRANPLTALLGLMGLKAGAHIQPVIHKAAVKTGLKQEVLKPLLTPEEVDELIAAEKGKKKEKEQEVLENK